MIEKVGLKSRTRDTRLNSALEDYRSKINEVVEELNLGVQWNEIKNKPDLSGHTHPRSAITNFWATPFWNNIPDKPSVFPPSDHAPEHEVGGGDLIHHDDLTGFVASEHVSLPNTIFNVLSNHTKAIHDALGIDADTVDGEHAGDIVTNARVKVHFPDTIANILSDHTKAIHDALNIDADLLDGEHGAYYLAWANITGKPSTYPPSSHSHPRSEVTDFWNTPFWASIPDKPATYPPSAHTLASHSSRAHSELTGVTANLHHAQLHEISHRLGGGDELNHDNLAGFVLAEHLSLPNTIASVLSDHNKAVHDALGIDADTLDSISSGSFLRRDVDNDVSANTEWQDGYKVQLGNSADFCLWHDAINNYVKSFKHGANIYLQAEDGSGTNRTCLTADPDFYGVVVPKVQIGAEFYLSNLIANDKVLDSDKVDGEHASGIVTNTRVKAHFPDTIANILSNHTKTVHDTLGIDADTVDSEHASAIVTNARVKAHFPDTIANVLSNHTKAIHDALGIDADTLDTLHASSFALTTRKLDDFGIPDDNTDLNATTSRHGLLLKLGGGTTNFLRADGTWAVPSTGAPSPHAPTHHAGGSDPLTFSSIAGFSSYIDQVIKTTSDVNFNQLALPADRYLTLGVFTLKDGYHYSSMYRYLKIGILGTNRSISLGVDVSGNTSSHFGGNEIFFPYGKSMIAPNSANNDFIHVLKVASNTRINVGGAYIGSGAFGFWLGVQSSGLEFNSNINLTTVGGSYFASPPIYSYTTTGGTTVRVCSSIGNLARYTSSKTYKDKIKDLELDSSLIYDLRPVSFNSKCKADDPKQRFVGLIAEEVEKFIPEIINYSEKKEVESFDYNALTVLLLKEVQRLNKELISIKATLN